MGPCVFNNAKDEFPLFAFRIFVCSEIVEWGLVYFLLPFLYRFLFIVRDGRIIDNRISEAGKLCIVIHHVSHLVLDETDEVVDPVFLVVRDYREDLVKYLAEFREMGVRGLAGDGLKIF